ncbi:hypothetical protein pb186bvf_011607 [Paramecium bursaria]
MYQQIPQSEIRKITAYKHKLQNKVFYWIIGVLFTLMFVCLSFIILDQVGYIKLQILLKLPQPSMALVQTDIITMQSQEIESEIQKLKSLFHETLIETSKLKTPSIDKNNYEYFQLDNGLKVLVIQDSEAQLAQAALCVHVGSWSEPDSHPGLAHFLEHMLFQGSKTYPQEGYFQKLVAEAGGSTNAYTRPEETNYYFKINNERILEALQVFSHFFIDPAFDSNMVDREVNAVNSEYEIAVSGDVWKLMHLIQIMSKKPVGRFSIGSKDTLKDPMEALIQFYNSHYSANLMSLVVKSNYKEMGKWIREQSDFQQIPNKQTKKMQSFGMPLKATSQYIKYKYLSIRLIPLFLIKKQNPLELIANTIRSKHSDGLLDYLVKKKLALSVDAGTFLDGNGLFSFFLVEVQLLDAEPMKVAQAITGYFSKMMDEFFTEIDSNEVIQTPYLENLWTQYKQLSLAQFNYLDKNNQPAVQKLSHNLNTFDYKDVFSIDFLYEEFDPTNIYNYLAELVNPSNMLILHGNQNFKNLLHKSALYRLEYQIDPISDEQITYLTSAILTKNVKINNSKKQQLPLTLPPINQFIPSDFNMKTLCLDSSFIQAPLVFKSKEDCIQHEHEYENLNHYPHTIKRTAESKVYWKLQRQFHVPQIFAGVLFSTPKSLTSLKDKTLTQIFNTLLTDNLNIQLSDAIDAGYQLQVLTTIKGVSLELYGWSDNFEKFYDKVLRSIKDLNYQQFAQVMQKLQLQYNNIYQDKAFKVAMTEYLNEIMLSTYYSPTFYLEELKRMDENQLKDFQQQYFKNFRLTTFFSGNILRNEVDDLVHSVRQIFHESSYFTNEESHQFNVKDLKGKSIVVAMKHRGSDETDLNGVTINYYQIGHRNKKNFAIMNLIQSFMHNHAFQYLRTERQLGYVAMMRFVPLGCIDGAILVVQGTAEPPHYVNQQMQEFLKQFHTVIKNLNEDQMRDLKLGAKSQLQDKDKSLYEESNYLWAHIKNNNIVLEEREVAIAMIDDITHEDIIEFYEKVFIHKNGKLSLQVYGKGLKLEEKLLDEEEVVEIKSLKEFKCSYTLSNI